MAQGGRAGYEARKKNNTSNRSGDSFLPMGNGANSFSNSDSAQTGRFDSQTSTESLTRLQDIFGFIPMLQSQMGGFQRDDAARRSFLSGLMQDGSASYLPRLQEGVNYALSGPGMTGAGDAARSRAAAFAANQAQNQETQFQLAAADQLARSPSSLGTLLTQFAPLMPQEAKITERGSGTSSGTGVNNTTGFTPVVEQGGGCYFTTAACEVAGEEDDGKTLTILRKYRDNWLKKQVDGKEIIKRYYEEAPTIVKKINARNDAKEIWQNVYDKYIIPIRGLIQNNFNKEALTKYVALHVALSDLTEQ